jgi:hypothetical protein
MAPHDERPGIVHEMINWSQSSAPIHRCGINKYETIPLSDYLNICIVTSMFSVATADADPAVPEDPALLADEIARMAAHLDAATHRLLGCIRRFDDSGEWGQQGLVSCAHWLSWRIGLDLGTAREKVRVARALGALPRIDDALRRGVLSYAKVRAVTRVATPENEERLLDIALASTGAQLERVCRRFRRVLEIDQDGERLDKQRFVRDEVLPSGLVRITAVLQPDEAALVMKAIEMARQQATAAPSSEARDLSAETSPSSKSPLLPRADALTKVAESFLAHGESKGCGGDRYQIIVHLDQDALAADGALAATLDDGTRVSPKTFRRLACDAGLVPLLHGAQGEPVQVGRRTRTIPPSLRRALWARDRGCRFPGCTNRVYVHAHHIEHWAHGGPTSADNLVLLCSAHHRLVHEGSFQMSRSSPEIQFRDPRGHLLDQCPAPAAVSDWWTTISEWTASADSQIDENTNFPAWDGTPVDYDGTISALLE